MNREQRRHPEKQAEEANHRDPSETPTDELVGRERTQDDFSVRAKNSGHKKKTADKWNQ